MPTFDIFKVLTDDDLFSFAEPHLEPAGTFEIPGSGTPEDPYIIENVHVRQELKIKNTDACFVIRNSYVSWWEDADGANRTGKLNLNFNGRCVHVHHNFATELNVNALNSRTGYATGGLIEHNQFRTVESLRHHDGVFAHNQIGCAGCDNNLYPQRTGWPAHRIMAVDGFNQGRIHNNTFYGSVDLDFHGHYHGTGFFSPHSHYHGDDPARLHQDGDHTQRWHSIGFVDNLIIDPDGYGLRYEDKLHRKDDRWAESENVEHLNEPHRHFTHVELARNEVRDGGLRVDVFNADRVEQLNPDGSQSAFNVLTWDYEWIDYHPWRNDGWLDILDNTVRLNERIEDEDSELPFVTMRSAMAIQTAKEVDVRVHGNHISFAYAPEEDPVVPGGGGGVPGGGGLPGGVGGGGGGSSGSDEPFMAWGVQIDFVSDADLDLRGNHFASDLYCGVRSRDIAADVGYRIVENTYEADLDHLFCEHVNVESPPQISGNQQV